MWKTWFQSLGQEDPPAEGNGNPLQYSCLENPVGGWKSLVNYSPWGPKESDMAERLHFHFQTPNLGKWAVCSDTIALPWWLSSKESTCNAGARGDAGSIPVLGRPPGGSHGNPLQYSSLETPMDRGAWRATVHRVAKCQTRLKWFSMHAHSDTIG